MHYAQRGLTLAQHDQPARSLALNRYVVFASTSQVTWVRVYDSVERGFGCLTMCLQTLGNYQKFPGVSTLQQEESNMQISLYHLKQF